MGGDAVSTLAPAGSVIHGNGSSAQYFEVPPPNTPPVVQYRQLAGIRTIYAAVQFRGPAA